MPTGFPILESFSMAYTVMDVLRPANRSLTFELWEWTGSTTGALLASAPLPVADNPGNTPVFTGPLALTEGGSYLAFFRTTDVMVSLWRHQTADLYADGLWVMSANWPNFETLINGRGPFDSRFSATFSGDDPQSVPEPTTLTLLALGLVAAVSRRPRRRSAFHPTSSR